MKNLLQPLILAACIAALPVCAQGETIIDHFGQANPTTEGWTELIAYVPGDEPGTGSAIGTGVNDNGTDAWEIETSRAWLRYEHALSDTELADMADGWEALISMRIDTASYTPGFDANFEVATGNWVTSLLFGTDANGAPSVSYLNSWTTFAATPVDLSALNLDSGYHTYKLSATGDVATISLSVDDNFVTNITALPVYYPTWEKRILWGDTERGPVVLDAFYSEVAVGTPIDVPEPSTLAMLLGVLASLALIRRVKK